MPTEYRTLIFTLAEVETALVAYLGAFREQRPVAGEFLRCDMGADEPHRIHGTFADSGRESRVELRSELVGAAMISYCRAYRIPLPKRAKKRLRYMSAAVALDLTNDTAANAPAPAPCQ